VIGTIVIEAIFINMTTHNIIIEILLDPFTEAIIAQAILEAILGAILLGEPGESVADRLDCPCPVLVAAGGRHRCWRRSPASRCLRFRFSARHSKQ
jgi:hypothetical protein